MHPLFRPEAVEAQRLAGLGRIVLARPLSATLLTGLAALTLVGFSAWLAVGEYTRKARIDGQLLPVGGLIAVAAPADAVIVERRVRDGDRVRAGDVLFVLSVDRATAGGDAQMLVQRSLETRERSLRQALAQSQELGRSQQAALERRLADLLAEAARLQAERELHQQRMALVRQSLAQLEALRGDQFISDAQVQARRQDLLALQAQDESLQGALLRHRRDVAALEAERRELPLQSLARAGEIERELAEVAGVAAEAEARRRIEVRAPLDAVASAVVGELGQPVRTSDTLASLMPSGAPLQAVLLAPSSAIGFLRPEQPVALRYHAFPYQKFGHQPGTVVAVSRTPVAAAGADGGVPMYRVTVALARQDVSAYGQPQPLVAGMQLQADVMLDRRRLYEWLFEPLWSVTGRV